MPEGYFVIFDLASLEAKRVEMEKNETSGSGPERKDQKFFPPFIPRGLAEPRC